MTVIGAAVVLALPASAAAATYTVNTTADSDGGSLAATCGAPSPTCSLRDAIKYSASGDRVVVLAGTYSLTSALPAITHDLTITGAGASSTTVAANGTTFGVFTITGHPNVSMSGLTITGGKLVGATVQGAGINTTGNLTLTGVVVTGNKVENSSGGVPAGGGIEVGAGNLSVTRSQITSNVATTDSGGGIPEGAGIDDAGGGLVTISASQITSNASTITSGSGGIPIGGGIHDGSPGTMTISGSQISQNTAASGAGSIPEGGGLETDGGGVVTITGSTLNANSASTSGAGVSEGGGIASLSGSLSIANTSVSGNVAISVPPGATPSAEGGGIYSDEPLALSSSTVSGNTAVGSTNGTAQGGGLALLVPASITNSTVTGNSVSSSGTGTSHGGGILDTVGAGQSVSILNSTIDGNSVAGGTGGSSGGNSFTGTNATAMFENTILSSGAASTGPNCAGSGTTTSQGHNLESGTDCGFTASGDHQNTDPKLGPLQDNGGPTQTQAVQPASPIIDAGNAADCPGSDQRGVTRPQGPACDIGALEVEPPQVTTGAASGISQTGGTLNGTVTPNTLKATAASYHFDYGTTTAYGSSTPAASGSGTVSASLTNLPPNTTYHFRLVASNADGGTAAGHDQTFTTRPNPPLIKPKLTGLLETNRVFAVGATVTPLHKRGPDNLARTTSNQAASPHPRGTVFSFTLNQIATLKIKLSAQKPGRQQGRRCKPPSSQLRTHPSCTRSIPVATLTRSGVPGLNLVSFTGRLPHRVLAPGRYQAVFTASSAGGTSGPQTIGFTIVKR
jgi:CSLREA domain-containing protein